MPTYQPVQVGAAIGAGGAAFKGRSAALAMDANANVATIVDSIFMVRPPGKTWLKSIPMPKNLADTCPEAVTGRPQSLQNRELVLAPPRPSVTHTSACCVAIRSASAASAGVLTLKNGSTGAAGQSAMATPCRAVHTSILRKSSSTSA